MYIVLLEEDVKRWAVRLLLKGGKGATSARETIYDRTSNSEIVDTN